MDRQGCPEPRTSVVDGETGARKGRKYTSFPRKRESIDGFLPDVIRDHAGMTYVLRYPVSRASPSALHLW